MGPKHHPGPEHGPAFVPYTLSHSRVVGDDNVQVIRDATNEFESLHHPRKGMVVSHAQPVMSVALCLSKFDLTCNKWLSVASTRGMCAFSLSVWFFPDHWNNPTDA